MRDMVPLPGDCIPTFYLQPKLKEKYTFKDLKGGKAAAIVQENMEFKVKSKGNRVVII